MIPMTDQSPDWYYPLINRFPQNDSTTIDPSSTYLCDNQRKRFLERYFQIFILPDVGNQPLNDICILHHSNSVCTVGLAPGHHLFRGCYDGHETFDQDLLPPHRVLGVDYDLGSNQNRLSNSVSGRRKKGGQSIGRAPHVFAYAVCDRNVRHKLIIGLPGRLIEVNHELKYLGPSAAPSQPLRSLVSCNRVDVGPYLCILLPLRGFNSIRQTEEDRSDKTDETEDFVGLDGSVGETDAVLSHLAEITKEKVLSWEQYSQLRHF